MASLKKRKIIMNNQLKIYIYFIIAHLFTESDFPMFRLNFWNYKKNKGKKTLRNPWLKVWWKELKLNRNQYRIKICHIFWVIVIVE
jgi:hypothetical protein